MITLTPTRQTTAPATSNRSGRKPSKAHAPEQRADDEHAAVGREDPAEVRVGLQRGHRAVARERHRSGEREEHSAPLLDRLPHQVRAADLSDGGDDEQRDRAAGHAGTPRTCCTRSRGRCPAGGAAASSNRRAVVDVRRTRSSAPPTATGRTRCARSMSASISGSRRSRAARGGGRTSGRCRAPPARGSRRARGRRVARRRSPRDAAARSGHSAADRSHARAPAAVRRPRAWPGSRDPGPRPAPPPLRCASERLARFP